MISFIIPVVSTECDRGIKPGVRPSGLMNRFQAELEATLAALERASLRRRMRVIESANGARVSVGGRDLLMLSSNNYLGLANHPALKAAAQAAIENFGTGSGASRLVAGNLDPIERLERRLARFKGTESALVFGSGYLANIGVISALASRGDVIFSDELNHASLIDGCRLSRAEVAVYRHCDMAHLRTLMEKSQAARRFVVSDAVFSMDGDCAPLADIVELAEKFGAAIVLDEAHSVGVIGPQGKGLAAEVGVADRIDVTVGTLSKALGAYGAYVAGSRLLIDFLTNRARSFIFTTGLPPAMAAAAETAIDIIEAEPQRIAALAANGRYLRESLTEAGFEVPDGSTPIVPVIVGQAALAQEFGTRLLERGLHAVAIRPPTVAPGRARIRLTPIADHSRAELERAVATLVSVGRELGII
jgi:8-amino-7-oxononanoate synthase